MCDELHKQTHTKDEKLHKQIVETTLSSRQQETLIQQYGMCTSTTPELIKFKDQSTIFNENIQLDVMIQCNDGSHLQVHNFN